MRLAPLLAVLLAASACAQTPATAGGAASGDAGPAASGSTRGALPPTASGAGPAASGDATETEAAVAATVAGEGVHVVHLWAPWCGNSTAELADGLYEVVEGHPDVTFSFVAIWNDGRDGASTLARYGITPTDDGRVTVAAQPDLGSSADRALRRRTFLGLPLSWTPTTWVFNRGGALAYAFNYGEVSPEMLELAIEHAGRSWDHD